MKIFLALTFFALTQANIHQYYAESNVICDTCQQSVSYILKNELQEALNVCIDATGSVYTPVCSQVFAKKATIQSLSEEFSCTMKICEKLNLCADWTDDKYEDVDVFDKEMISDINNDDSISWKAGINKWFVGMDLAKVRTTLGAVVDSKYKYSLPKQIYENVDVSALPTDFDAREQWSQCSDVIGHVRDQSACGSCWAFGSTESWNDRLCISNSSYQQLLSSEDTMSCCTGVSCGFSNGCAGGQPSAAWQWFSKTGVVSGGDYSDIGQTDTCEPYEFPPCAHHVNSSEYAPCPSTDYSTPACKTECSNKNYAKSWNEDKHIASKAYSISGVENIMQDIYNYGSVAAAFTVYQDFLSYTSGVYVHTSGDALGGHAIKMIGWGVENGQDYWLCVNSWNESWGDKGLFKILKGKDECGIESDVSGGVAK